MADIIGRLGSTYKFPIVDEIPEELRPEEVVFVKDPLASGLWIGASENVFTGLDEGTPWPLKGYKEYSARISQSGEDAPEEISLAVNEIGDAVWSRITTGTYQLTLEGAFKGDTIGLHGGNVIDDDNNQLHIRKLNDDAVRVSTYKTPNAFGEAVLQDGRLPASLGTSISIKTYPAKPE